MRRILMTVAAGMAVAVFQSAAYAAAEDDMKAAGCVNCHEVDKKKVGPAFKDISAKYKGKAGSDATLVAKVKGGKEHPATKASDDDLNKIVKWSLAM